MPFLLAVILLFISILSPQVSQATGFNSQAKDFKYEISFWEKVFQKYNSNHAIFHEVDPPYKILKVDFSKAADREKKWEKIKESLQKGLKEMSVRYQTGLKGQFEKGFKEYLKWEKTLKREFKNKKVPYELLSMIFVESMFQTSATSAVNAGGIWQLMPPTARELKLKVNKNNDERRNILISTKAAAKLLAKYFRLLKSWPLAIAGYNSGAFGIRREVRKFKTKRLKTLLTKSGRQNIGFASWNFYPSVIAAEKTLKKLKESAKKVKGLSVEIIRGKSRNLKKWSKYLGFSYLKLKQLNPNLKNDWIKTNRIVIPKTLSKKKKRALKISKIKIKPNENLSIIASYAGITVAHLKKTNGIRGNKILVGQVLKIPVKNPLRFRRYLQKRNKL